MRILRSIATLLLLFTPIASHSAAPAAAPAWELNDLQGEPHKLEEWRGKWVLLKFGRTDCPNCATQWEEFGKAAADLQKYGVGVLDIFVREERQDVKKHVAKKTYPFQPVTLYDWKGETIRDYAFSILPHLVLVNPEGKIAWQGGFTTAPDLSKLLASNIGAGGGKKP